MEDLCVAIPSFLPTFTQCGGRKAGRKEGKKEGKQEDSEEKDDFEMLHKDNKAALAIKKSFAKHVVPTLNEMLLKTGATNRFLVHLGYFGAAAPCSSLPCSFASALGSMSLFVGAYRNSTRAPTGAAGASAWPTGGLISGLSASILVAGRG